MTGMEDISIEGLKGWGGWGLFFLAVIWWIRGIPDRKRANTEGDALLFSTYDKQIEGMQKQIDGLIARINAMQADHDTERKQWQEERELWRHERQQLLAQVAGIGRQATSISSSTARVVDDVKKSVEKLQKEN